MRLDCGAVKDGREASETAAFIHREDNGDVDDPRRGG